MRSISKNLTVSRRAMNACVAAVTLTLSLSSFLTGCGGSSGPAQSGSPTTPSTGSSRGRATFTIVWPAPTRLIPSAANSIVISLSGAVAGGPLLGTQTISRPAAGQGASVVTFENMEPGSLVATASAFPTTDGTDVAQASGQVPLTIVADETAQTSLTMNSTIDHLDVSPPSFRYYLAKRSGPIFGDPVTVTARNAAGDVVLTPTSNYAWTSSAPNTAFARLIGTEPRVFAVGPVSVTTLTVRENESGKTAALSVDIHGPLYSVTDLGQQVAFSLSSDAFAINATGAVAGYAVVNNKPQAVIWQNGASQNLGSPISTDYAYARDINDAGVVVGYTKVGNSNGPSRGFVWEPSSGNSGQFTDVPPPTGSASSPLTSINNQGQAAGGDGYQGDIFGPGFIFDIAARTSTRLPTTSPVYPLVPSAINDSGIVVANVSDSSRPPYLYQNGVTSPISGLRSAYAVNKAGIIAGSQVSTSLSVAAITQNNQTTLLFPSNTTVDSVAYGLNNQGFVVGSSSGSTDAFVWGPGINGNPKESTSELLNYLIDTSTGWQLQIAHDVNDRGQIVGVGQHNGRRSAFLLTPIP